MAIANVSLGATTSATAASKTTITVTPSTAPTNGDSLVVTGSYHTTGTGSFSDNGSPANTYTIQKTGTNTVQVDLGTVLSVGGSPTSITYSNTSAKGAISICVAEYSGVSSFGNTASNTGSTSPATVALTTQDNNDWVVGSGSNNSTGTLTASAGTNLRSSNTTNIDGWVADSGAVATSGTSQTLSIVLGTPAAWAFVAVNLRPTLSATTTGAGTEKAAAAEKLSQAVSGAGTEKTSTSFVLSQKTSGAGLEKTTVALVASQKVSGAGTEKGVGTGSAAGVSASGAGTEKAVATTLLSQKTSGAGTEKTSTAFVLSQKTSGEGLEKTSTSFVLSQKTSGAGLEKTTVALVASQKVSGAGSEKAAAATTILSQTVRVSGTATAIFASGKTTSGTGKTSAMAKVTSPSGFGLSQAVVTVSTAGTSVGLNIGPTGPRTPAKGCLWFATLSGKLSSWNGSSWVEV